MATKEYVDPVDHKGYMYVVEVDGIREGNLHDLAGVYRVVARGVRLRGKLIHGKISWGEIDRLLPPPSNKPFELPNIVLDIADSSISLATPLGPVGIAAEFRRAHGADDGQRRCVRTYEKTSTGTPTTASVLVGHAPGCMVRCCQPAGVATLPSPRA